ncbi:hypothetical protein NP233_g12603 [Leucocoprinus birnbaumii]|uniref:Cyclin N-terminal domain-containing protein n=1 Tax=Leucocoprinus birnbaumii TaxID=56174 RepID=A0AAD5VGN9_9AGAR|nr:hypothetical protein NP233_g12603 [Leucocoprinus birnbaumii]
MASRKPQGRLPFSPPHARRSPRSAKLALLQQQQRLKEAQFCRKESVLLEEEYRDEIRYYMHDMEVSFSQSHRSPPSAMAEPLSLLIQRFTMSSTASMDQQPEIRWHMRPCLVDFLVEVHFTFRLRPETLYLTLNIVDRYVSRRIVYIKHYQLVGCAALWIAAKFEDAKERVPTVQDLAQICRETYEESAFIQMEGHVLSTIQWTLGHPTAEAWLRLMCCGPYAEDTKVQHVARFLMEITLFYREFIKYTPSAIALASLTLARYLCGKPRRLWEETDECIEIIEHLDARLSKHVNDLSETLIKKYSYAFYSKAATFVVQYYLQGGRFVPQSLPSLPVTPKRTTASAATTPMSSTTSLSDMSDDMPMTPTTPTFSSDPFSGSYTPDDKENQPTHFEPVLNKHRVENVPEQYLPHDFVTFGRSALHNLNISSPRTTLVS